MPATILTSVFASGGRASRFGEFTMVYMHGSRFIATAMEFMQMQNWARGRPSSGNAVRDRSQFLDRFETVLGGAGCGVSTRGPRPVLQRIVKAMKANAVLLEGWNVPHDIDQSVEIARPKSKPDVIPARVTDPAVVEAANAPLPKVVVPLVSR